MAQTTKIYPPTSKMLRSLIGSALLSAAAGGLIIHPTSLGAFRTAGLGLAYMMLVLFLWLLGHTLFRLVLPKPLLVLSDQGVMDQSSIFAVGFIPWEDIKEIEARSAGRERFVSIELENVQAYITKAKGLQRTMMNLNLKVGHGPIKIPDSMLPMRAAVLADQMRQYRSGLGSL